MFDLIDQAVDFVLSKITLSGARGRRASWFPVTYEDSKGSRDRSHRQSGGTSRLHEQRQCTGDALCGDQQAFGDRMRREQAQ